MSLAGYNIMQVTGQFGDPTADEHMNLARVPQGVDVSAMEVEFSVVGGLSADTGDIIKQNIDDGGATGTGTTNLATDVGDSDGWTNDTPQAATMSSTASDLDADDYLDWDYDETGTVAPKGITVMAAFVHGVPGAIA